MGALHRLVAGVRTVARTGACQRFHRARLSLGSPPMRAIRRFTVRTTLPEPLHPLGELVENLRWSWHLPPRELFAAVDPQVWAQVEGGPGRLLGAVSPERL